LGIRNAKDTRDGAAPELRLSPRRRRLLRAKGGDQIPEKWRAHSDLRHSGRICFGATKRASDKEIAALRDIFSNFADGTPSENIDEYSDANIAFHQALIRLSGSDLIINMTDNLFLHVRSVRRVTIAHGDRAERSLADHLKIIEALAKRNAERAEKLSREHALGLADHVEKFCNFLD
jgi:DNA-binding GntR family transcriptional regulator